MFSKSTGRFIIFLVVAYVLVMIKASNTTQTPDEVRVTEITDDTIKNDKFILSDGEVSDPEIAILPTSGVVLEPSKIHSKLHTPVGLDLLQKITPQNWIRPVHDKLTVIKDYLTHLDHPNYGGLQHWNPQQILEKINEGSHHFLTGINGAVFGINKFQNHDYPFPYKRK